MMIWCMYAFDMIICVVFFQMITCPLALPTMQDKVIMVKYFKCITSYDNTLTTKQLPSQPDVLPPINVRGKSDK